VKPEVPAKDIGRAKSGSKSASIAFDRMQQETVKHGPKE
jgi:hypothetical protein